MGLPILNNFLPEGLLVGLNSQPPFWIFPCVPSVLDIVASILDLRPLLIQSLLYLIPRYQVLYQRTLQIHAIILETRYVVLLSNDYIGIS